MRVPLALSTAFGADFEKLISEFATEEQLMPDAESIRSVRFLARSVIPHIEKLSSLFNRLDESALQEDGLQAYWKNSSNPPNLRLAYFLYFMPSNLYRVASIWAELARLGYRWPAGRSLKGLEVGAGPASGACGIAAGERFAPVGLTNSGNWALIEQDKAMLDLGAHWASEYFSDQQRPDWGIRTFHRKVDLKAKLLPPTAPKFNLWLMSYFLNESTDSPDTIADTLLEAWDRHLEEEGIVILVEPALKAQSRRILELRKSLLKKREEQGLDWLQVLLPCLGHQSCGALAAPDDWCHEEVSWWRPPYFRTIDKMAGLDRKTLPFSYLVLTKSKRTREQILPVLAESVSERRYRLVSPAHSEGKDMEFFLCGQEGKRRARYRPQPTPLPEAETETETATETEPTSAMEPPKESPGEKESLTRGDILLDAEIRGDIHASRVQTLKKIG